jgi:hypothetical protein
MCEETAQLGKVYTTSLCFSNEQSARGKPYSTGAALLARPRDQCPQLSIVNRWDEKAGLRRDAIRSQVIDALEAQTDKGDRQ